MIKGMQIENLAAKIKGQIRSSRYPSIALFADQYLYGHLETFQRYYSLRPNYMLRAVLQHGWTEDTYLADTPLYFKFRRLPILVWSLRFQAKLQAKRGGKIIGIGSPWAHNVVQNFGLAQQDKIKDKMNKSNRFTILYFPRHSYHGYPEEHSETSLISKIRIDYPEARIITSLYWLDFIDPRIRDFYESTSDAVFCPGFSGSLWNQDPTSLLGGRLTYLSQVRAKIEEADLVVSAYVGTPYWYALSIGQKVLLGEEFDRVNDNPQLKSIFDFYGKDYRVAPFTDKVWVAKQELGFDLVGLKSTKDVLLSLSSRISPAKI
jgi:hypothetical protein